MKKLLLLAISMTVLRLYGMSYIGYGHLPRLYSQMETDIEDVEKASRHIDIFIEIDFENLASAGEREALEWTRKYVELYPQGGARAQALEYLAVKGDERYLEVVRGHADETLVQLLEMRVAGVNVFDYHRSFPCLGSPQFFPAVTNTGPQAVYVREILFRCWEEAGKDSSKIPQELLAMVVSFDDGLNPVCSVDLAKYGLSMPTITPRPDRGWFHWSAEGILPWDPPVKFSVKFPDLAEPVEITPYMSRKSPEWEGLYAKVKKVETQKQQRRNKEAKNQGNVEEQGSNRIWFSLGILLLALIIPAALTALLLARRRKR